MLLAIGCTSAKISVGTGLEFLLTQTISPLTDHAHRLSSTQAKQHHLSVSPHFLTPPFSIIHNVSREHGKALSARQVVAQSRKSRGFFSTIFRRSTPEFRPTYNYKRDGSSCRIYGTLDVKKVTGAFFF